MTLHVPSLPQRQPGPRAGMGDGDDGDGDDGDNGDGDGASSCRSHRSHLGLKSGEKFICYANVCLSLAQQWKALELF